jgi:formamidopyrimidine-DNA glycosylase
MPELPEVETIVRELKPLAGNKTIDNISVPWARTVGGKPEQFAESLTGNKLADITRRGKYICIHLENSLCLTIHLRMTGKLLFEPDEKDRKYIRVVFRFTDGSALYFVDVRKFGRMKIWEHSETLLPHLGPEPLDEKTVFRVLSNQTSRRAIKTLLLDQSVLAGVGNIYADEALFMAKIHPLTPANKVPKKHLKKLSKYLPEILKTAIENNGTTISDYRKTDRSEGGNQLVLKVYGREGEPCITCGTPIARIRINNRSAHFCPSCPRAPASSVL